MKGLPNLPHQIPLFLPLVHSTMEAFNLLKYWRGGGGGDGDDDSAGGATGGNVCATIIANTVDQVGMSTDEDDDEEGSFFDMEFAVPEEDDGEGGNEQDSHDHEDDHSNNGDEEYSESVEIDGEKEFNFTLSSESSGRQNDSTISPSPSDDLFFKEGFVPVFNPSEPNSKPQFPISLLKSATKFRVFLLGFKKPRPPSTEKTQTNSNAASISGSPKLSQQQRSSSKSFTVKFKVDEVPIVSLFTRENSSRIFGSKLQKQNSDEATSDDKRFSKDVVQKYLKMIKPLYVKVSRRYGEKLKFSGQFSLRLGKNVPSTTTTPISSPIPGTKKKEAKAEETEATTSNVKTQKQGNFPAGLRVVCKHLGKSRSASSAVAAMPPAQTFQTKRTDDSLLQQQDGIQSAILHCKRSFNSSRDFESYLLSRSTSDPSSYDKRKTCEDHGKENRSC